MPEEAKQKYKYEKVAKKGYLYKNDRKREGGNDPDYKGKLIELEINALQEVADEDGKVILLLSGWSEEDQSGTPRVSLSVQKAVPLGEPESEEAKADSPF